MRFRIIEFRSAQTGADLFEIAELAAAIRSDALMGQIFQHIDDGSGDAVGRLGCRLAAQEHAALAVDQSDTTGFPYCAADGIGFPVAQPPSFIGDFRPLCELEHERMPAAVIPGRFPAPPFAAPAQSLDGAGDALEIRTDKSAAGDAAVDRRIADGDRAFLFFQAGGDLLGRPLPEIEKFPYPLQSLLVVELSPGMADLSAGTICSLCHKRRATSGKRVPFELSGEIVDL